jgi:hypothetical protein
MPLDAGTGQAPQSLEGGFGMDPLRTVADENEHLGRGPDPDALDLDHRRGALHDQFLQMGIVGPHLGIEVEPAPGDGAQAGLGRGRRGGERARAQRG